MVDGSGVGIGGGVEPGENVPAGNGMVAPLLAVSPSSALGLLKYHSDTINVEVSRPPVASVL